MLSMNKSKKILYSLISFVSLICFGFSTPFVVNAQGLSAGVDSLSGLWDRIVQMLSFGLAGDISSNRGCIPWAIARTFVNWAGIIAGLVLLGFIIYGGITYLLSQGVPGKVEQAQKTIVNAMIGFVIVILSWTVAGVIMHLFGVSNSCVSSGGGGGEPSPGYCLIYCQGQGASTGYWDDASNSCVCQ